MSPGIVFRGFGVILVSFPKRNELPEPGSRTSMNLCVRERNYLFYVLELLQPLQSLNATCRLNQ